MLSIMIIIIGVMLFLPLVLTKHAYNFKYWYYRFYKSDKELHDKYGCFEKNFIKDYPIGRDEMSLFHSYSIMECKICHKFYEEVQFCSADSDPFIVELTDKKLKDVKRVLKLDN